jgi:hypothetical protein
VRKRGRARSACAVSGLLLACCSGFGHTVDRAALARQDDEYVRIVLELGVRDPDSLDFYAGPAAWLSEARAAFEPLTTVKERALTLIRDLAATRSVSSDALSRRALLIAQLRAVAARVDQLQGRQFAFDEESRALFDLDIGERDPQLFARIRSDLETLLPGPGSPAERFAELERQFVVPADRLPLVVERTVAECRRVTLSHLALPLGEHVDVEYVHDMRWPAFTTYEGGAHSRTRINLDVAFPLDRVVDLACHETYPGHHTIGVLLDPRIQPLFSPQSLRTEAAASYAPALVFSVDQRVAFERETLMRIAGLLTADDTERYVRASALVDRLRWQQADLARRYLDGRLEFVRAARALHDDTLLSPPAAESMLKFINEFRTYLVAYTAGRDLVRERVEAAPDTARWQAYASWLGP